MALKFCTKCGTKLEEGMEVCPNCGAQLIAKKPVKVEQSSNDSSLLFETKKSNSKDIVRKAFLFAGLLSFWFFVIWMVACTGFIYVGYTKNMPFFVAVRENHWEIRSLLLGVFFTFLSGAVLYAGRSALLLFKKESLIIKILKVSLVAISLIVLIPCVVTFFKIDPAIQLSIERHDNTYINTWSGRLVFLICLGIILVSGIFTLYHDIKGLL